MTRIARRLEPQRRVPRPLRRDLSTPTGGSIRRSRRSSATWRRAVVTAAPATRPARRDGRPRRASRRPDRGAAPTVALDGLSLDVGARRDRRADRPERLRQVDVPAGRRRAARARNAGAVDARRRPDHRAGSPDRARVPGAAAAAVAVRRGQRHLAARARRLAGRPRARRGSPSCSSSSVSRTPRGLRPGPALGRDAPAGGDRPGARPRPRGPPPRRAVQRARRADPRAVQPRAARRSTSGRRRRS